MSDSLSLFSDPNFRYFLKALGLLFIAVGPVDNAVIYAGLGHNYSKSDLKSMAFRGCAVATVVIMAFALGGAYILKLIDIDLYSLNIGGGILLLLLSIQIVMDDYETANEFATKQKQRDLSIFPLAMPLIAGPAVITLSTQMIASAESTLQQAIVLATLLFLMILSYILFRLAGYVTKFLGDKGGEILARVLGILLAIIAADLIIKGLQMSGLFG